MCYDVLNAAPHASLSQEIPLQKLLSFSGIARLGAFITFLLFCAFTVVPALPFAIFNVTANPEALLMARRMAALFLGVALILYLARNAENSTLRRSVCTGLSASMAALALFGLWDFAHGSVGNGIWLAVAAEGFFTAAFGFHARKFTAH